MAGWPRYCAAMPSATVLLVEDDPVILQLLEVNFELEGYVGAARPRRRGGHRPGPVGEARPDHQRHHDAERLGHRAGGRPSRPTTPRPASRSSCCRPRPRPPTSGRGWRPAPTTTSPSPSSRSSWSSTSRPSWSADQPEVDRDPRHPHHRPPRRPRGGRHRRARRDPPRAAGAGASTATGRRTWRWPRPRPPGATRASSAEAARRRASTPSLPAHVVRVEIAGPGFVNFHLARHLAARRPRRRGRRPARTGFARPDLGGGRRVNVEFVSANPTGPLHAGHGRWARLRRLAVPRCSSGCGHDVAPGVLPQRPRRADAALRRLARRPQGRRGRCPRTATRASTSSSGPRRCPTTPTRSSGATSGCSRTSREALARHRRRVRHVVLASGRWSSRAPSRRPSPTCATRGVVYDADGAVWLRSTDFGDDKDRVLVKSDGESTYLLPDIAYHRDKFARGFELLIDVWGADHHGYVAAHEGRRCRRSATTPTSSRSSSASSSTLDARRRGGAAVQADRRHRRALDDSSTRSAPTPPGSPSCCSRSTPARPSTSTSRQRSRWRTRSSTCSTPTPGSTRSAGEAAEAGRRAGAARRRRPRPARPRARARRAAVAVRAARGRGAGVPPTGRRTRSPPGCASWPARFHGFYHDCYVVGDGVAPELTQARLWLVEAARIGLRHRPRPARRLRARGDVTPADDRPAARGTCCPTPPRSATDGRLVGRRLRPARPGRASSARRCSSTTRPTSGPAAARRSPRSATAWPTRPRRSSAWPWRGWPTRRACTSTWPPAASSTSPSPPACPPTGWCCTATTSRSTSCAARRRRRRRPHRRRQLRRARPPRARSHADGRRSARRCSSGSRPGVEAHTHEFVRTGQDDSKFGFGLAAGRRGAGRGPGAGRARPSTSSASTPTSAARCSWPTSSTRPSRSWPRSCDALRPARAVHRRRPRRRLRRGRGGADDHRVGRARSATRCARRRHRRRASPAEPGPGDRRRRPASRSTRSARSRTSPASAPTCRSTAA